MYYDDFEKELAGINSAIVYYAGLLNGNYSDDMRTEDFTYVVDFELKNSVAKIVRVNKDYSGAKIIGFISTRNGKCYNADDNGEIVFNGENDIESLAISKYDFRLINDDLADRRASIARWDDLSF